MGNQKLKWTAAEEGALRAGVLKHGIGKWKIILTDPEFSKILDQRSNIDLKDKWRNLCVVPGVQGGRDKSRVPKVNDPSTAIVLFQDDTMNDPPSCPSEGKVATWHNMIFEALSSIQDGKGSDMDAIVTFIEQRNEVPPNFRKLVSSKLRRLVSQGKVLKIQNCYKINDTASCTPKNIDARPECSDRRKASQNRGSNLHNTTLENAAMNAAYKIAEAENKSFVAAESVKEAERISKMAEETEALLQLVTEIYEQCKSSRGQVVLLA